MNEILSIFSLCLGALIGSFLNVVIWRVPRGESIVMPPSHCPKCNAPIKWHQNIPVFSWLMLSGKCANCREPISRRYPAIEAITAVLFLAAFCRYGFFAPIAWIWLSLMVVGSCIDFDLKLLPDFVTVGGMILGVVSSLTIFALSRFYAFEVAGPVPFVPPLYSILGLVAGFGFLWLIRFFGSLAFKREAMGLGDVFLMGAIGAICGPVAVLFTTIVSSVAGSIVGIAMLVISKTKIGECIEIPYGPYLCVGCLLWMLRGPEIVDSYMKLLSGT